MQIQKQINKQNSLENFGKVDADYNAKEANNDQSMSV